MASSEYFQWLESMMDYSFRDPTLLENALTGPGAEGDKEGTEEEKIKYEGNRMLASLGRSLLSFMIERRALSEGKLGRGGTRENLEPATAGPNHIKRAKDLKIDLNMKLSPRTRGIADPRTLQVTLYAIVGAVWQDCEENFSIIDNVIKCLFISTKTPLYIDPQQISFGDLITTELLDDNALEQYSLVVNNSSPPHSPVNIDLIRDSSSIGADLQTFGRTASSYKDQQLRSGVGDDQDPVQHNIPFDNETSVFPLAGNMLIGNRSQGRTSPLPPNHRLSTIRPKRDLRSKEVQGSIVPKKQRLSTSNAESRQFQLHNYVSLEERRCQSYRITFPWADIDSAIRASNMSLKESDLTTLKTLFFVIGSPESLVALQEILKVYRTTLVNKESGGCCDLSLAERVKVIEDIGPNIAYLVLRKRCHIYQLFSEYSTSSRRTSDGFVIDTTQSISRQEAPQIGNPNNLEDSRITEEILKEAYPDLKPDTEMYRKKRRFVRNLRKLGERFDMLVRSFGYGILGLLSWPGSELYETPALIVTDEQILSLSDTVFKSFVLYLKQVQGNYLSTASNAVSDIVTVLFRAPLDPSVTFALELVESSKILQAPKDQLLLHLIS